MAIQSAGLTQAEIAAQNGTTEKTLRRLLAGDGQRVDLDLALGIYRQLGYDPATIFEKVETLNLTGIRPIDTMLAQVYTQHAQTGVAKLSSWVAPTYRCCSPEYSGWNRNSMSIKFHKVSIKKEAGIELYGIDYETEAAMMSPPLSEVTNSVQLQYALALPPNQVTVAYLWTYITPEKRAVNSGVDVLKLSDSLVRIQGGHPFLIEQKTWIQNQLPEGMYDMIRIGPGK